MIFKELFENKGLSLDRLKSFMEVVEAGSIVLAAGQDPNRQSQFSRQIKELEFFFGAELTRREGRRITITEEGERLARIIRSSFTDLSDFRADSQHEARRVVLAAGASVIEWLLPPAFLQMRRDMKEPVIVTQHARSSDVIRGLDDGRIDMGIMRGDALPSAMAAFPIGSLSYRLFVPKELSIEKRPRHAKGWDHFLSQLPQARLLGGRMRRAVDEAHQAMAIRPQIVAEMSSFLQLAALVRSGSCAAILPVTASAIFPRHEFDSFELDGFLDYQRDLFLVFNRQHMERRGWGEATMSEVAKSLGSALRTGVRSGAKK
ncbi:MAG: LysR family transcriptional regulator [Verrucomicrobiales bacterium]